MNGHHDLRTAITTAASLARPSWVRWQIVALLMGYSFMNWFNRVSISVADQKIMDEFQFSSPQIGMVDSALLLAYTLCMTPGGWLIDRFGPRKALVVMGFGSAFFVALTCLSGHPLLGAGLAFASFLVIRSLMGSVSAPIYPASGKTVSHWVPFRRRAWANGLITGAAPLGIATAHVLFGYLTDVRGWRTSFVITGTFTAVLALLWTRYSADSPSQHPSVNDAERQLIRGERIYLAGKSGLRGEKVPEPDGGGTAVTPVIPVEHRGAKAEEGGTGVTPVAPTAWGTLLRNRSLVLLTLSYAAVGYFEYLFIFCTEYYFKAVLKLDVDVSRRYSFIATLAMVVTMPLGGLLSDLLVRSWGYQLGRALVPVIGMVGSAATLFAAAFTQDPLWTLIWFTLAHGAIGATEGSFWTTAIELGGRSGGTSGAIVNTGGNAGGVLAPYATRWIGSYDWRMAFCLGSVICLVGVCLWWWIDPRERVNQSA